MKVKKKDNIAIISKGQELLVDQLEWLKDNEEERLNINFIIALLSQVTDKQVWDALGDME